ncbi:hypothetical protein B0T24DRAFT_721805 [Lasiosphaeria ovina]|uniref:Rhodopsin domain-containing protein n=1 Tax=Lasiosphaeria ovina TaxID=92902 RepID=A0AAE0K7Y3_9PEZI|nr:hypothetical protein B0T24DRAFT_721805 [Lasiosphaeria ovina]
MAALTPYLSGGPVLLSFSLATSSFAFSTTFVRFCVRSGINKHIGYDDYVSAAATVVALIGTIFGIIEGTTQDGARAVEFDVLGQPWYLMSVTLSKISICLLFISLLGKARQWRILLGVLIFLLAAVNLSFSLTVNLQCRPLEKLWNPSALGECWNPSVQLNFGFFQGAFSVFTWFFLALFPVLIVRDLRIDGDMKWPFYVSFTLSLMSGIFATVKTAESAQLSGVTVYTSHNFIASLMANLEQNLGLMAANVLTLGPLFSAHARHLPGSSSSIDPSRAGSTRSLSRASSYRTASRGTGSKRSSIIDLKRTTHLIIEGPRLDKGGSRNDEYDLGDGRRGSIDELDVEAWPRGIIKTVSVEVFEEPNPDHVPAGPGPQRPPTAAARSGVASTDRVSDASGIEQDWEAMLRNGPPGR